MARLESTWVDVQAWLLEGANAPLLLVLLLLLWLLLIVRRREDPTVARPRRPEPITLQEMGRLAFQAARSRDERLSRLRLTRAGLRRPTQPAAGLARVCP